MKNKQNTTFRKIWPLDGSNILTLLISILHVNHQSWSYTTMMLRELQVYLVILNYRRDFAGLLFINYSIYSKN